MPELGPILFLPGDGIGAEVMVEVRRVIGWLARRQISFAVEEDLVGGAAYDVHGVPLAPATLEKAKAIGTVMFGAVGGPKWDSLPFAAPFFGVLAASLLDENPPHRLGRGPEEMAARVPPCSLIAVPCLLFANQAEIGLVD